MQAQAENLRLFKYVPPERIDILENEKIAFTPPDRFKDPFEFRIGITRKTARNQLKEVIAQAELRAELTIPGYKELSSRQRRIGRKEMFRQQNVTEQFQKAFQTTVQTHACRLEYFACVKRMTVNRPHKTARPEGTPKNLRTIPSSLAGQIHFCPPAPATA
jgi:hypothetical protein